MLFALNCAYSAAVFRFSARRDACACGVSGLAIRSEQEAFSVIVLRLSKRTATRACAFSLLLTTAMLVALLLDVDILGFDPVDTGDPSLEFASDELCAAALSMAQQKQEIAAAVFSRRFSPRL